MKRKVSSQKGGDGQGNGGHDVSFPLEFYGGKSNNYFPTGSPELSMDYTKQVYAGDASTTFWNDLSPGSYASTPTGTQTGGGKKGKGRRTKKKGGFSGLIPQVVNGLASLVVPIALLAGREAYVRYNDKTKKGEVVKALSKGRGSRRMQSQSSK
jgi:hypothetical protein